MVANFFNAGKRLCVFLLAFAVTACSTLHRQQVVPLEEIKLPPRFAISVYARDVPRARTMTFGTGGTLFVGTYAEVNHKEALGIFSVVVDPFKEQEITFTDFNRLFIFFCGGHRTRDHELKNVWLST